MDPVCMLTIYPQLLQNFVYKPPQLAKLGSVLGVVDSARYLFCRDLTVADAFCRKFVSAPRISSTVVKNYYCPCFHCPNLLYPPNLSLFGLSYGIVQGSSWDFGLHRDTSCTCNIIVCSEVQPGSSTRTCSHGPEQSHGSSEV